MNVLVLIEGEKLGGAEQDVLRLARELGARSHGVVIGTTGRPMRDEVLARGHGLLELPAGWGPRGLRAVARGCRDHGIDLLNPHSLRSTWLCGLAVRGPLSRLAIVTTIHNVADRRSDPIARLILRAFPDDVTFVSRYERERLQSGRGRVIHTGIDIVNPEDVEPVDLEREHGIPRGARVIGYVGRLSPEKAIGDAIAALERLPADTVLCLVGQGPEEDLLRLQAQDRRLAERVVFAGFQRDVPRYLRSFELVVLCSRREALPVALREAGMMGLASVAADVGGVREVVVDGETGALYPSGDVAALAARLAALLDDAAGRARMGAAARQRVARLYGVERWVDETLAVFEEAASRAGSKRARASG